MSSKEVFEKEIQFVTHRKGFKLVDPHVGTHSRQSIHLKEDADHPSCPLRFEGIALLGKKIVVHVPKRYCHDGIIIREKLAIEGFCGFAERSKELYDCQMSFKPNSTDQWRIEIGD